MEAKRLICGKIREFRNMAFGLIYIFGTFFPKNKQSPLVEGRRRLPVVRPTPSACHRRSAVAVVRWRVVLKNKEEKMLQGFHNSDRKK